WIASLGGAKFNERESAQRELEWAGIAAVPALKKALADSPPAEVRRRIEFLLSRLSPDKPSPVELQAIRGIEALQRIGTPAAREIVADAASGAPGAFLTRAAKAAD